MQNSVWEVKLDTYKEVQQGEYEVIATGSNPVFKLSVWSLDSNVTFGIYSKDLDLALMANLDVYEGVQEQIQDVLDVIKKKLEGATSESIQSSISVVIAGQAPIKATINALSLVDKLLQDISSIAEEKFKGRCNIEVAKFADGSR